MGSNCPVFPLFKITGLHTIRIFFCKLSLADRPLSVLGSYEKKNAEIGRFGTVMLNNGLFCCTGNRRQTGINWQI